MMEGFLGFNDGKRMTPKRKNDVVSVAITPILGVNPVDPLNALHDVPPVYWFPSTAVALDRRSKRDN
jgi:hypothetical protein